MKHYDGPTFFRQHPEEITRLKKQRRQIARGTDDGIATEAQSDTAQIRTPISESRRYGNEEIEIDRSTASMYASQQARALDQTVRPRRHVWHPGKSESSQTQYISAPNKPFATASAAYSESSEDKASSWGKDDWSHKQSVSVGTNSTAGAATSVTTGTKKMFSSEPAIDDSDAATETVALTSSATVPLEKTLVESQSVGSHAKIESNEPIELIKPDDSDDQRIDLKSQSQNSIAPRASASQKVATQPESANSRPQTALGHGLADILNEEQNGQKDLALFNHDHADSDNETRETVETGHSQNDEAKIGINVQTAAQPTGRSYADETDKGLMTYHFPSLDLLKPPVQRDEAKLDAWIEKQIDVLNGTLSAFNVDGEVVDYTVGPTVTQFQVSLGAGVRVNKITNLQDDLKLALAAKDIRIEAPIPGQSTVGIEIPDLKSRPVMLSEVLRSDVFKNSLSPLTVALGVDLFGKPQVTDLRSMPHGLIAGATGSGKSVFINSLLMSIMYKATPQEVKLILIDPKAVEMAPYNGIPHLLSPVVSEPQAAAAALKWAVNEMEERYQKLAAGGARNIEQFNEKATVSGHPEQ